MNDRKFSPAHNYKEQLQTLRDEATVHGIGRYRSKLASLNAQDNPHQASSDSAAITIIIPFYNASGAIERCLESIRNQTLRDLELICIDDGSTDDTVSKIYKFYEPGIRLSLIRHNENRGQGLRRNEAMRYATGKYVTFMDADDYFANANFLQKIYDKVTSYNLDILITPALRLKNDKFYRDSIEPAILNGREAAQKFLSRDFGTHAPWAKLYRRAIAQNCDFINYGFSEDVLFVFRTLLMADSVQVMAEYGYVYDNSDSSSWRPDKLTGKHFYSSIRLLAEILTEFLRLHHSGIRLNLEPFLKIWANEHGKRIAAYLSIKENLSAARYILKQLEFIRPFLMSLLDGALIDALYENSTQHIPENLPFIDQPYLESLKYKFDKYVLTATKPNNVRKKILIYTDHLSSGGLEKVAVQAGNVLSSMYDIFYVIEHPERDSYEHQGIIIKNDIFNPDLLSLIAESHCILDFSFKENKRHYPFCAFATANFASKYIPTIHNTKTCANYFDKLQNYTDGKRNSGFKSIICVSQAVRNTFAKLYGASANLLVLHNPLEFDKYSQSSHNPNPYGDYILFMGRLNATRHKGIDIILRAFAQSSLRGKCKIIFAGEGVFDYRANHIIDYFDLRSEITCLPFTQNIAPLLKNARFLCAPSRWEGFSLSLIESLACSTPVLTSPVGGAEEVVLHKYNGFLCKTGYVKSVIEGMEWLFEHGDSLRSNCKPSVLWLDIKNYSQKLLMLVK